MAKTIVHISFSSAGGAGTVARVISNEQVRQGMDSSLMSVIKADLRSAPFSAPFQTIAAGLDEYLIKSGEFSAPVSLMRDRAVGLKSANLSHADVIHLHGVNGALATQDLSRLAEGRKIVWTLHDMNPFTGGCHYSLGCEEFASGCAGCPAVRAPFRAAIKRALLSKVNALIAVANLSVVAPSSWLAELARKSAALHKCRISVIPNPIDPLYFEEETPPKDDAQGRGFQAIAIAKNLSDPVKAIGSAVSAFRQATEKNSSARLVLIGHGGEEFSDTNVRLRGPLAPRELARELDRSDVLILPSRAENAPLVVAEAAARGCLPLAADVGGVEEMVRTIGYGQTFSSAEELISLLKEAISTHSDGLRTDRHSVVHEAKTLFSPEVIVARYGKVYEGEE